MIESKLIRTSVLLLLFAGCGTGHDASMHVIRKPFADPPSGFSGVWRRYLGRDMVSGWSLPQTRLGHEERYINGRKEGLLIARKGALVNSPYECLFMDGSPWYGRWSKENETGSYATANVRLAHYYLGRQVTAETWRRLGGWDHVMCDAPEDVQESLAAGKLETEATMKRRAIDSETPIPFEDAPAGFSGLWRTFYPAYDSAAYGRSKAFVATEERYVGGLRHGLAVAYNVEGNRIAMKCFFFRGWPCFGQWKYPLSRDEEHRLWYVHSYLFGRRVTREEWDEIGGWDAIKAGRARPRSPVSKSVTEGHKKADQKE